MDPVRGRMLVETARQAIAHQLLGTPPPVAGEPWLLAPGAVFVTLRRGGALRGCIGSLEAYRPLFEDLRANALAAAFHDPRFPSLRADELEDLEIEVSLLSPPEPLRFSSEEEALAQLRPGRDGVVLSYRGHRGTFLPQVWKQLPEPRRFLARLKEKAGLPADFWDPEIALARYAVDTWCSSSGDGEPRPQAPPAAGA
ncbi:MAG: AmmeMemoRadiSam system protein A [Acidobacteria bacterium]|nr:MAG: AmmeMemoRadiSam system protein A [Acidobacteriota bacterium]